MEATETPATRRRADADARIVLRFFVASLSIKLALLLVDAQPRFYLGDSQSYLATGVDGYYPLDRSWLYGLLAVRILRSTHGFLTLIGVQTVVGALVSASVGAFALIRFGVSRRTAWILVIATSLEPLALYYERSVLTETIGQALFWSSTILLVLLADRPSFARAVALAVATVLAVAFRTAFVPQAFLVACLCAWVALRSRRRCRPALASAAAAALVLGGLRGYATVTGALVEAEPAINPRAGAFLVGLFSPLLTPADLEGLGVRDGAALLQATGARNRWRRNEQTFDDDGLFARLERELGGWRAADRAARKAARRAVLRDLTGPVRLAGATAHEFLDERLYHRQFKIDAGLMLPLPEEMVRSVSRLTKRPFDAAEVLAPSLCSRWFKANLWAGPVLFVLAWALPLLLVPAASWIAPSAAMPLRIVGAVSLGYIVAIVAFSLGMAPRFLLPVVPGVALMVAVATTRVTRSMRPSPP